MPTMRCKHLGLLGLLAAGVLSFGSASYGEDDPSRPPGTFDVPTQAAPAVQSDISDNFEVFRKQQPGAMPEHVRRGVASPERFGRNADLARAIDTAYGTGWVIPGDGYVCLAVPDPVDGYGTTCTQTRVAIEQGLWLRLASDDAESPALDVMVVPDGRTVKKAAAGATETSVNRVVTRLQSRRDPRITLEG